MNIAAILRIIGVINESLKVGEKIAALVVLDENGEIKDIHPALDQAEETNARVRSKISDWRDSHPDGAN